MLKLKAIKVHAEHETPRGLPSSQQLMGHRRRTRQLVVSRARASGTTLRKTLLQDPVK